KRALRLLDAEPVLDPELFALLEWAAAYYQHPVGQVLLSALPVPLRRGLAADATVIVWRESPAGGGVDLEALRRRAPRQAAVLAAVRARPGSTAAELDEAVGARDALAALATKGWIAREDRREATPARQTEPVPGPVLLPDQAAAIERASAALDRFHCFLLNGVTGSGKTEVYLRLAAE